ncbi:beta-lactamase-like protein [Dichotomocladium elegans]|nr:beta-lactamase-like protein [Dichotomocladium elegans]
MRPLATLLLSTNQRTRFIPHYLPKHNLILRRTMKAYLQFVGHSSPEGPPSIIVHYDSQRYLFNCREGTQRLCVEEKVKWSKLKDVYLSRVTWDCVGGLPGMLLTIADGGVKDVTLHGPKNLTHFLASTRHFIYREHISIKTDEFGESCPSTHNGPLTVIPVVVLPNDHAATGVKRRLDQDVSKEEEDLAFRRNVIEKMFVQAPKRDEQQPITSIDAPCTPANEALTLPENADTAVQTPQGRPRKSYRSTDHLSLVLPPTTPFPAATSFICRGPTLPGKFNVQAAKSLGIKPGPLYGKLQRGETVTLEDGRVIEPSQVMGASVPGHVFVIVDCPNVRYLDNLLASPEFAKHQTTEKADQPDVVIHLIGQDVLDDARYREWMNKFNKDTQHIISTEAVCAQSVLYNAHAIGQVKLSQLDDQIFPIPKYNNTPTRSLSEYVDLPPKCYAQHTMTYVNLEPRTGVDKKLSANRIVFNHTSPVWAPKLDFVNAAKEAKQNAAAVDISEPFPGDDVQIITLGTGSSVPSKYRNVSATLVQIPKEGSVMLDAGEGTFGQMMRRFGLDKVQDELNNLQCIFVSHLHADHHIGVIHLLVKWWKHNRHSDKRLYVVAPTVFKLWLEEYSSVEQFGLNEQVFLIRNETILFRRKPEAFELANFNALKQRLNLSRMEAVTVFHCRFAYGLTISHESGWKLVYSGDTRPCESLVKAGRNATLLIHEATLEDNMEAEAIAKRHSTTREAVEVGQRMNAKYTLLNHFSQRYPKLPLLSKDQQNVCFSFDMMSVPIKQIPILPKFTDAIRLCFEEEAQLEDEELEAEQK